MATAMAERLDEEFQRLRGALLAHCYRMVGSYHDAEDLVQETWLRARRGIEGFEERSSIKSWLYRIATNRCLTALKSNDRRVLPAGLGAPSDDPHREMLDDPATAWIEPFPDVLWQQGPDDPVEVAVTRDSVRLALIATLQHLPPRQRTAFLLREVLDWPANDIAKTLGISTAAVKSLLQRARAKIAESEPRPHAGRNEREVVDRYIQAFETSDLELLEALIHDDFSIEAPPSRTWFKGKATCLTFLERHVLGRPGSWKMRAMTANGQPAVASYHLDSTGRYRAFCLCVLDVEGDRLRGTTVFRDLRLLAAAGVPAVLEPAAS